MIEIHRHRGMFGTYVIAIAILNRFGLIFIRPRDKAWYNIFSYKVTIIK